MLRIRPASAATKAILIKDLICELAEFARERQGATFLDAWKSMALTGRALEPVANAKT